MSGKKRSFKPRASVMGLILLLVVSIAAFGAAACGDSTSTTSASVTPTSAVTVEETTVVEETTTESVAEGAATTESTEGQATETSAAGSSVRILGENDSGNEVAVRVGDRVRIELQPYVNDRVKSVKWNYEPIIVREVDSGTEVVSDVVVECWLELEAAIPGPVTVRAEYEYPYGTRQTAWVAFFIVREQVQQ